MLVDLRPLDRVLARFAELDLDYSKADPSYAAQCPYHRSDQGRLNFEVVELASDRRAPNGRWLPAGAVLLHCQAYGDLPGPGGCTQENVIASLGLWPCDLFPGKGEGRRGEHRTGTSTPSRRSSRSNTPLTDEEVDKWEDKAAECQAALPAARMAELADRLGLPAEVLALFHVGWRDPDRRKEGENLVVGHCWTIPERDGRDRITAINRRYEDGSKRVMYGGQRGLYIPDGWRDMPGPVYCPEGFSDAAALRSVGACVIGRPNVGAGSDLLAELLADVPRPIVIVGENDGRRTGNGDEAIHRWPGRDGAVATCRRLRRAMGRPDITVQMPPEEFKDIREFINDGGRR